MFYPQKVRRENRLEARSDIRSLPLDPTTPPRSTGGGRVDGPALILRKKLPTLFRPRPPTHSHTIPSRLVSGRRQRLAAGSFHLPTRAKAALFLALRPDHRKGSRPPGGWEFRGAPEARAQVPAAWEVGREGHSACCHLPAPGPLPRPHLPDPEKHPRPQQSLAGPRRRGHGAPAAGWSSAEIFSGSAEPGGWAASTTRHP